MSDFDTRGRKAADAVRRQIVENTRHTEKGIRHAQRSPARVAIPIAAAAALALIAGVVITLPPSGGGAVSGRGGVAYAVPGALKPFDTCDTVLQYFKDQAPEYLIAHAGGNMARTTSEAGAPGA